MILFLLLFLMGCQAEQATTSEEVLFAHEHAELSDAESTMLQSRIAQLKDDESQQLVVAVPAPMEQSKRFSRAFWQSRKVYLQAYLTQQGVASKQVQFKECPTCSTIHVS